jgi:hypothetical protein
MRRIPLGLGLGLTLCLFATSAPAQTVTWSKSFSTFIVNASNPTAQPMDCSISYALSYEVYGAPNNASFTRKFSLAPHFDGIAFKHETNYSASSFDFNAVSWSCATAGSQAPS